MILDFEMLEIQQDFGQSLTEYSVRSLDPDVNDTL